MICGLVIHYYMSVSVWMSRKINKTNIQHATKLASTYQPNLCGLAIGFALRELGRETRHDRLFCNQDVNDRKLVSSNDYIHKQLEVITCSVREYRCSEVAEGPCKQSNTPLPTLGKHSLIFCTSPQAGNKCLGLCEPHAALWKL